MNGILYSYLLIMGVVVIGMIAGKLHLSPMLCRKFVHMGVGFWWFVEMAMLHTLALALIPPITFIVLNTLTVILHKGESEKRHNYGLVYYPISLVILVLFQFKAGIDTRACLWGILALAFGDSFAAIFGAWYQNGPRLPGYMRDKTLVGSLVMFVVTTSVGLAISHHLGASLLVALVATIVEAVTPYGLDNISIPVLATLVASRLL